jgi:hypothetical protein
VCPAAAYVVRRGSSCGRADRPRCTHESDGRFRFSGTQVGLVAVRGRGFGRIGITIDGVRVAMLDMAATIDDQLIVFRKQLSAGRHTIEVRTLGTARSPRTGARVDNDGFLVIGP